LREITPLLYLGAEAFNENGRINSWAGCPGRTIVAQLTLVPQLKFVQVFARI